MEAFEKLLETVNTLLSCLFTMKSSCFIILIWSWIFDEIPAELGAFAFHSTAQHILILSNVILVAFLAENYYILDNETLMFVTDQIVNKVHRNIIHQRNLLIISITLIHVTRAIQVLQYNSLVVARQNVPITSVLTNCTLGS